MKVLSVWQPWATLLGRGIKEYETRSWDTPFRGLVAIQAAKSWSPVQVAISNSRPMSAILADAGLTARTLDRGMIVAVGFLCEVRSTSARFGGAAVSAGWVDRLSERERAMGDFRPGRYGWQFEDMIALREPITWSGQQGLRELPHDVSSDILDQVDRAKRSA
jgi:activating signal cointegrator 1